MDFMVAKDPGDLRELLCDTLRKNERVLLCFPEAGDKIGSLFGSIVVDCGGVSIFWGDDFLWKSLLRKAFSERCGTVIGSPEIILGLGKLAKRQGVPLYIRKAILIGHVPDLWMIDSIRETLDCRICACCELGYPPARDEAIENLSKELRRWTTILDFRMERMGAGLSLEMVTFPGEKLPALPSFARMIVRNWNPNKDCPFDVPIRWKNNINSRQNH